MTFYAGDLTVLVFARHRGGQSTFAEPSPLWQTGQVG